MAGILVAFHVALRIGLGNRHRNKERVFRRAEVGAGDLQILFPGGSPKTEYGSAGNPHRQQVAVGVEADDATADRGMVPDLGVGEIAALIGKDVTQCKGC